jgi:HAD superfamily hydrolase (TIGR01509 family)
VASNFFEAIFFDMDGLTINSEPQWLEAEIELTAPYGYQWQVEDQAFCLGGPLTRVGQYMSDVTNGAQSGEYFHKAIVELMAEKVGERAEFMPGARELLNQLQARDIPLALVSASPRLIVNSALNHVQPIPFKVTISSDDVLETKPNPEGYLKAARDLGVNIANCLILEDSATGVQAARASGAKVIAVPHLVRIEPDAQTKVIKSLEELTFDLLSEFYINW